MVNLLPHQSEALEITRQNNRVAYYYDMGLGKTYIGSEKAVSFKAPILLICQKSKVSDWVEHFTTNYPKIKVFDLTSVKNFNDYFTTTSKCVGIINYDLVWRRPALNELRKFTLMLDESQNIQTPTAKRSRFILRLHPDNVILLSGTPTSGKYESLWTQLQLLGWKISQNTYWNTYIDYSIEKMGVSQISVKKVLGYKNVDRLKVKLREYGCLFKKTDEVMTLPEQVEVIHKVQPTKAYGKFRKDKYVEVEGRELIGDTVLTQILYERQLCGVYSKEKLEKFRDILESTHKRVIVFYNFYSELDRMMSLVGDRSVAIVNGKIHDLSAYETDENSVTFLQYQSGATGLNLQKADTIIYFTLPLGRGSSGMWEQSKKRIHRIGQQNTCFYHYLLVDDSIETRNLRALRKGEEYNEELFKNG